jgi:hypothetical protein
LVHFSPSLPPVGLAECIDLRDRCLFAVHAGLCRQPWGKLKSRVSTAGKPRGGMNLSTDPERLGHGRHEIRYYTSRCF